MGDQLHAVLCVDDEKNILNALKRLLRKEHYRLFIASNGSEGLDLLKKEKINVVMSDQRMPGMSGTEFLAKVKEDYPEVLRIVLTGFTDVDSITESVNKGHIYKILYKPWNDENLKLEIRQALDQYDLIQVNKNLNEKVLEQNETLKEMNENLETLVRERTKQLEIQNRALELSRAILEQIPLPVIGVSCEGLIVFMNQASQVLAGQDGGIGVGGTISDCFPQEIEERAFAVFTNQIPQLIGSLDLFNGVYDIEMIPIKGDFQGKGLIMAIKSPA